MDFLTFKPFHSLFEKDFRINKVIALEKKHLKSLRDIKYFSENLKEYDFILDLHNNLRTHLLSLFSNKRFIRYKKGSLKRRLYTYPFFRKFIDLSGYNVLLAYQETLKFLNIHLKHIQKPEIILSPEEIEKQKKFLPDRFIVLGAGARYKNKMYPYFNEVSERFLEKGLSVVLLGSEEDKRKDTSAYPEEVIDLRGSLSIRESLSVISLAELTVSNDSAIAHMSRAVSTPVLMIYGATHPYFGFAPLPDEGKYIYADIPCHPCDIHGKKRCKFQRPECLYSIPAEEVVRESMELLNGV